MIDNISFYNPKDIGYFDLGVSQINKTLPFKTTNGVFTGASFIKVYKKNIVVKEYNLSDGLTIVGSNVLGQEKTLSVVLNGADFANYKGVILEAVCSFFVEGDLEVTFSLGIK